MANKEKLQNASTNALDKFFTQGTSATETAKKGLESNNTNISPTAEEKAPKIENKAIKEVFSFRAERDQVIEFRSYCEAKYGMKVDDICTQAMIEYIHNHPLEKFEEDMYKKAVDNNRNKMYFGKSVKSGK